MMAATILGAAVAATWVYLIALRGGFWRLRRQELAGGGETAAPAMPRQAQRSVVAVMPSRDEAAVIGRAVASLAAQRYGGPFHIVLVDDHSSDGTAEIARKAATDAGAAGQLTIVTAEQLPPGWSGKLWAVDQGIAIARRFDPGYLLLTDADIVHPPDNVADLVARAEAGGYDLVSLMVMLHCGSLWERLLIPAFVFFFFKLFPPRWVADRRSPVAAAAGGCMLVRPAALERIGGIASIRDEIIDDCALARRIKARGGSLWLGIAPDGPEGAARSIREYRSWRPIWDMITRCAFAQLGFSAAALAATVAGMLLLYAAPPALLLFGAPIARVFGGAAWAIMSLAYMPMLGRYRRSALLAPLLPLIALFYTTATVGSAVQYWRGRGGRWKGRYQAARV
jgi:hopene-associated glycosyltransferase HpnB